MGTRVLYMLKYTGLGLIVVLGLALAGWAAVAWRARRPLPDAYYRAAMALHGIVAVQFLLGVVMLLQGPWPGGMHIFYGAMTLAGGVALLFLRPRTALGQQYRGRPLVHAVLNLAIALLAIRAFIAVVSR